jgi:DNA-binding response OmpR family regulator
MTVEPQTAPLWLESFVLPGRPRHARRSLPGVWGPSGEVTPRLRTHIAHLRSKLDGGGRRDLIRTEAGVGYRFSLSSSRRMGSDAR